MINILQWKCAEQSIGDRDGKSSGERGKDSARKTRTTLDAQPAAFGPVREYLENIPVRTMAALAFLASISNVFAAEHQENFAISLTVLNQCTISTPSTQVVPQEGLTLRCAKGIPSMIKLRAASGAAVSVSNLASMLRVAIPVNSPSSSLSKNASVDPSIFRRYPARLGMSSSLHMPTTYSGLDKAQNVPSSVYSNTVVASVVF